MGVSLTSIPGTYIDAAAADDGLYVATVEGDRARVRRPDGRVWHSPRHTRGLMELRLAVSPRGDIGLVAKDATDTAWRSLRGEPWMPIGRAWGQDAQAITWEGNGFLWGVVTDGGGAISVGRESGAVERRPIRGTSQGICQFLGSGAVLVDGVRNVRLPSGHAVLKAYRDGDWCVGQALPDRVILSRGGYACTVIPGLTYAPRLVVVGDTRYIVAATRGPAGCVLATVTPPDPPHEPVVTPSPSPPAPQPSPPPSEPPSEPEPIAMPDIPNHVNVVRRWRETFKGLSGDPRARQICNAVAWELRDVPEGRWGTFMKSDGVTQSSDVIALDAGEAQVYTFDILQDAEGEATPTWGPTQPTGRGDKSRWRAPVAPDALGSGAGPTPGSSPGPPLAEQLERLEALMNDVADQNRRILDGQQTVLRVLDDLMARLPPG